MKTTKKILSILLAAVLLLTCAPVGGFALQSAAEENIPDDAVSFNGHFYKVYDIPMTWTNAKAYCENLGGHLVTFSSEDENSFITSQINSIGVHDFYCIGIYNAAGAADSQRGHVHWSDPRWITQEKMTYENWNNPGACTICPCTGIMHEHDYNYGYIQNEGKWDSWGDDLLHNQRQDEWKDARCLGFICEWGINPNESDNKYPAGYNFLEDSYSFENYSATISKEKYNKMFGAVKGRLLRIGQEWKPHGLCYGFTYSTAAILNDYPAIERVNYMGNPVDKIRSIDLFYSDLSIGNNKMQIQDYIEYSHIYQLSKEASNNQVNCSENANVLLSLVKNYTDNNKIGVTISMRRKDRKVGHRVLAVGYNDNTILIDDPNDTTNLQSLTVNEDGSWSFSGLNNWNSSTCYIRYSLDIQKPYEIISSKKIKSKALSVTENAYTDYLSADSNLLVIDSSTYSINKNTTEVFIDSDDEYSEKIYWTDEKDITVSNLNGENNTISFAGQNSILSASLTNNSSIEMIIGKDENSQIINCIKGDSFTFSFDTVEDNQNTESSTIIRVSGTASDNKIQAKQTNNGIVVSGIENGTVDLIINDKDVSSKKIDNVTGKILIKNDADKISIQSESKVNSVKIEDVTLNYKKSTTLKPVIDADKGVTYTVKYESSNPKVATVDQNGKVTATKRGSGTATITCTVTDQYGNVVKDTCTVNVSLSFGQKIIVYLLFGWIWY